MYGYEWTEEYGIFRLTIDAKIQKEIRPVFHEELDFFGMDEFWDYPNDTDAPLLWAEGVRRYVLNGKCIAEAKGGSFYNKPVINRLTEETVKLQPIDIGRLYEVNRSLLLSMEHKSIKFIQEQYSKYNEAGYTFVCAFSGGKDSLVLLDLVSKALPPNDYYAVFSNTGMELQDTLTAVEKAKSQWPEIRFVEAKSHLEPEDTWREFGPPARRMRWCCQVHKSIPTILKIRELTGYYNSKAVVFDGVRAEESARRASYDEVGVGVKNISQINCHPILKWNTAEIYAYLLYNNILLNRAYYNGLFRVGCMVCPMSSEWWEGIANDIYHDEMEPLVKQVEEYAARAKSSKEALKYVENGGWKARLGGKGLLNGGNRVLSNVADNKIIISIREYTQNWDEVAKILGVVVDKRGDKNIQRIGNLNFEYEIEEKDGTLEISYYPFSKMDRYVVSHIRGVANKVAYCIGCKACMVQCPTGAFVIQDNGKITIRENICIHCYNCMTFTDRNCLVANNLRVPEGGFMNLKGLDPYHHFGMRQAWVAHFMEEGVDCFTQGVLGSIQYSALKTWLKDADMLEVIKTGSATSVTITKLGEKLTEIGPYNPFTWAIIWTNLAYNSTICRWYCYNAEVGVQYEKGDLVDLLGDQFSQANRENAITALTETLRQSPIGASIKQGLPMELTKNTYSYLRAGWDYPHAIAILYALYVYAEKTGKRSFTFTELVNNHSKPDGAGISPSVIFGLEVKAFKDALQALALSYPKYIRVSFIANLDNIILEDYSSLDVLDLAED